MIHSQTLSQLKILSLLEKCVKVTKDRHKYNIRVGVRKMYYLRINVSKRRNVLKLHIRPTVRKMCHTYSNVSQLQVCLGVSNMTLCYNRGFTVGKIC